MFDISAMDYAQTMALMVLVIKTMRHTQDAGVDAGKALAELADLKEKLVSQLNRCRA